MGLAAALKNEAQKRILHLLQNLDWAPSPQQLILEVTDACNLKCPMCPRNYASQSQKHLSFEGFRKIVHQMPLLKRVAIVGRGESLMAPELPEMLHYRPNLRYTITTNGTILTEKNLEKLRDLPNLTFALSVDSPRQEGYRAIRGANLEIVKENVRRVRSMKPDAGVFYSSLIMRSNIDDLKGFVDMALETGVKRVEFINLIIFEEKEQPQHAHTVEGYPAYFADAVRYGREKGVEVGMPTVQPSRAPCLDPWFSVRVAMDGSVFPCCYIYCSSEESWNEWYLGTCLQIPQRQFLVGNLFETPLRKIWRGGAYRRLRRQVRRGNRSLCTTTEKLKSLRRAIDLKQPYSYCNVCLYKFGCAC